MTEELLKDILEQTRKEAKFSRLLALIMAAILIVLLVVVFLLVPRAVSMMKEIETTAVEAQGVITHATETLENLESAMSGVGEMTESITKTSTSLFEGISKVDFDALSKAVSDLQQAVEPLANFARVIGR